MLHNPHYATRFLGPILLPCALALSAGLLVVGWLLRIVYALSGFEVCVDCTFAPCAACAALRAAVLRFRASTDLACASRGSPETAKPLRVRVAPPRLPRLDK